MITFIKGIFRDNFLIFAVLFFAVLFIIVLSLGDTKKVANAHIVETPTVEGEVMVVEQVLANIAVDKVNENLKGIKIKTKITKDGWGVTVKDVDKSKYAVTVKHVKDGYNATVIDNKDKIRIKIGE